MAGTILTTYFYDGVRALIAPDVTAAHISDAYLSEQPFAPEAERKVRKRLRVVKIDVDTLTGDNLEAARLAMMHACASVLCLTVPQMIRQTALEVLTEVQHIDWKEKRQFHESQVSGLVDGIVESVQAGVMSAQRSRSLPFGAVGTMRTEVGEPSYPYVRRVCTGR